MDGNTGREFTSGKTLSLPPSIWPARLRAMTGRIQGFFLPLEPVFLTTGEGLRTLHRDVTRLSSLVQVVGERLSANEFREIEHGLADATQHIDVLRHQRGGLFQALSGIISQTDTMLGSLDALARIMFHVQVLAVNAKIEASQLHHTGADFSVFTREIARLAKGGEQTIATVREQLQALRGAAHEARAIQQNFEQKELPELDALSKRLSESLHALHQFQIGIARGAHEIPGHLNRTFSCITDLVSDLQIFDTARQRLEHIEQALTLAAEMIEAEQAAAGMDELQQKIFVNGIAELQSLQFSHADEHYHHAVAGVGRSLATMARSVPEVGALCAQAFGGDGEGSVRDIRQYIEAAQAIFTRFSATQGQARQSLSQVIAAAERAGQLMRSLNGVNSDMQLMGLNAAIKCGNMGAVGRALSVIAHELQSYANLTRAHVGATEGVLREVVAAARAISSADGDQNGALDAEAVSGSLSAVAGRLQKAEDGLSSQLNEITTLTTSVPELTRRTDQEFSGKADCRRAMNDCIQELKALAVETDTGLTGPALEEARQKVLAFAEQHYTMASERSIHGAALGNRNLHDLLTGADVARQDAVAEGGEPDISALLF